MKTITAYKGFSLDWKCNSYQFEVGKSFDHEGAVKRCDSGFHSCEFPLDVFNYYAPGESRYAVVEASGSIDREENGDTKLASAKVHIKAELQIPQIITAAIVWITERCDPVKAAHSKGSSSASSATGYSSASSATGYSSASSATGYSSASSATGYRSASSATGDSSASSATGYSSASSATGYSSASSATGYSSASSATGYSSASSATGDRSASSATGDRSASSVEGQNSVAMNIGIHGRAKAAKDGAIVLCNHDTDYNIRHIRASKVGENGIKADTWYVLDADGNFQEAA